MTDWRVFVSIPVPGTPEMNLLRGRLKAGGARVSPPEQTHITLRFLGDVDSRRVDDIASCVESAVEGVGPFTVRLSGVGAFPNKGRPSVIWIGAGPADTLKGISDRLASELSGKRIPFDSKPFKAHVTVARCKDGFRSPGIFDEYAEKTFAEFQCSEVLVMRSVLDRAGATHSVLKRVPLKRFCGEHI